MGLLFFKGQALGNDYLVVDEATLTEPFTPELAIKLCDRQRGAGSDGVLVANLKPRPVDLRIFNPDGSLAEKSGNGLRIFGAYMYAHEKIGMNQWLDVSLARDVVTLRVEEELDDGSLMVRVQMGKASFQGRDVGFVPEQGPVVEYELDLPAGGMARVNTVSLGNPHCVVFVDELERSDFLTRAPQLCTHPAFAAGTNVQFARVLGPQELEAWIWERGVGETLASGSSACAVSSAAVNRGLIEEGRINVRMRGGSAEITIEEGLNIELLGQAELVYRGELIPGVRIVEYPDLDD